MNPFAKQLMSQLKQNPKYAEASSFVEQQFMGKNAQQQEEFVRQEVSKKGFDPKQFQFLLDGLTKK